MFSVCLFTGGGGGGGALGMVLSGIVGFPVRWGRRGGTCPVPSQGRGYLSSAKSGGGGRSVPQHTGVAPLPKKIFGIFFLPRRRGVEDFLVIELIGYKCEIMTIT